MRYLVLLLGCHGASEPAAQKFPTLEALYAGDPGMYRTCGPNSGVCHDARQYPNFATLGAIAEAVDQPCNQLRDNPATLDDFCERRGDFLILGTQRLRLGWLEPGEGRAWTAHLDRAASPDLPARIVRPVDGEDLLIADLSGVEVAPGGDKSVVLTLPDDRLANLFAQAGVPSRPDLIQLWDPNGNGIFGADLNAALIRRGAPQRSYLIKRLTDPRAGTLMPLANPCSWDPLAVRALWCWINGLGGRGAFDAIDYDGCPPGPDLSHAVTCDH